MLFDVVLTNTVPLVCLPSLLRPTSSRSSLRTHACLPGSRRSGVLLRRGLDPESGWATAVGATSLRLTSVWSPFWSFLRLCTYGSACTNSLLPLAEILRSHCCRDLRLAPSWALLVNSELAAGLGESWVPRMASLRPTAGWLSDRWRLREIRIQS